MIRKPLEAIMPDILAEKGGTTYTMRSGEQADVGVIDDAPFVVKTSKVLHSVEAYYRLWDESSVLSYYAGIRNESPLDLPFPYDLEETPVCAVLSKVRGLSLGAEELLRLSPAQRQKAGERLGSFLAIISGALDVETFVTEIEGCRMSSHRAILNFDQYFSTHLKNFHHPRFPTLTRVARECWEGYLRYYPFGSYRKGDRVNHNDLRTVNLTWEQGELVGIYDWGTTDIGNIHQELRGVYHLGPDILESAIGELAVHGIGADAKHVALWSHARSAAGLSQRITSNTTHLPIFGAQAALLMKCYPDDWTELERVIAGSTVG